MHSPKSYPLTTNQRAIWLEQQLHPKKPIFNIGTYVRLNGIPNHERLEKAISEVINNHDAMRICVHSEKMDASVLFEEGTDFELKVHAFESRKSAVTWMNTHFEEPISMDAKRLYDIRLITIEEKESYLFLKHHHIYIDGWARALLVRSIAQCYNETNENASQVPQFSRYLSKDLEPIPQATEDFWLKQFDDFDRSYLFQPKSQQRQLSSERYVKAWQIPKAITQKNDKEHFFFQLTCLMATLALSRGKSEITVGIPLLNRYDPESLETIGYFVGLLPLRIKIAEDFTLLQLQNSIEETFSATRDHRQISIQEINKQIGINFANHSQAYDVVFSFEKHSHACNFGALEAVEAGTFSSEYEQNPLVIHVEQLLSDASLNFVMDYNLKFLNQAEVETLATRFVSVLESGSLQPKLKLSELSILSNEEHQFLVNSQRGTQRTLHFSTIYEAIEAESKHAPQKIVLRKNDRSISHAELVAKAKNLAGALQNIGVEKGVNVGILLPRSPEVIEAIAGVIFAGGTFVYLDPNLAEERLQFIIQNSNIEVLIVSQRIDTFSHIQSVSIDDRGNWTPPEIDSKDPLYILYTSGTTGTPKGVSIPQLGILNLLEELNAEIFSQYSEDEELAMLSSFSFDASMQFIFSCLCLGQTLTIVPEDFRKDGRELAKFFGDHNITISDGIPTHLQSMMLRTSKPPSNFKVKHFIIGGEALRKSSMESFFRWIGSPVKITNAYGPTECSVDATLCTFDQKKLDTLTEIPIGRPVNNTQIYILDSRGIQVPPGVQGEISIAGNGMALAYYNEPELTQKYFQTHPKFGLIYKTGDQGYWNENGEIMFVGRTDNQVKIRGFRIELEEIENQILSNEGVLQAAVIKKKIKHSNQIIAFVVAEKEQSKEAIETALSKFLPDYMLPHSIQFIAQLPLTRTGKVDKSKLSEIVATTETQKKEDLSPTALKVQSIFNEILEVKNADFNHSFFSQGGDSLSLIFLLAEIEQAFGIEIPMTIFTHTNSIREISQYLDNQELRQSSQVNFKETIDRAMYWKVPNPLPKKAVSGDALITGTTGFVGVFLKMELLNHYDTIYCLVRSNSRLYAQVKSISAMLDYEIDWENIKSKLKFIPGDLALKNLGMSDEDYQNICSNVRSIYHCGADVHFLKDFSAMEPANVSGTSELLKIACTETLKHFHLISTVGIFNESENKIEVTTPIQNEIHTENNGYEATKWIAEGLTMRYRDQGIPASIYRLARITGHSETGVARTTDFFHRFILGCMELGFFPEEMLDSDTDLTPIDIATNAIVTLAEREPSGNHHIIHPERVTFRAILESLQEKGIILKLVPKSEFLAVATKKCVTNDHPLFSILTVLKQNSWFSVNSRRFAQEKTNSLLESHGITWPSEEKLRKIYANYFKMKYDENIANH